MRTGQRNRSVHFGASIVIFFFLCLTISSWIATQYFAHAVYYQDELGEAVWRLGTHVRIYQPFAWAGWVVQWSRATGLLESYVTKMLLVLCGGALISLLFGFFLYYRRSMKTETPNDLHGSARWAVLDDIEKMKLISYDRMEGSFWKRKRVQWQATGPYIGAFNVKGILKALRYSDPAHLLCYAPSRSGKGVGPVVTTLLSYPQSTMTNDIKGENYELTSGFRHSAGSLVIRFDPTSVDQKSIDGKSRYSVASCWNALDEVRIFTEYDVMDAQNLSAVIADPKGEGMEDHWVSTSYELLVGVVLHVRYFERDKTLAGVSTYLADPTFTDPEQMYNRMLEAEHDPNLIMGWTDSLGRPTKTHPQVAIAARSMLNKEEKERNSVLSTAKTKLGLYTEPIVARNTSRSDFCLNDLMNHDKPVSFYMVVPPSDKERLRPLIRLLISFAILRHTSSMSFEDGKGIKEYRHRLLMMIDELISLKKMEQLVDALSYMAGYGITAFLFVQDKLQLKDVYGQNETVTAGCQLRMAYAPNTVETAEEISKMLGKGTEKRQNVSYSGTRMGAMLGQMSVSEELLERELLDGGEVSRLPRDQMLVFNTGHPPILAQKLKYYEMPVFQKRAEIPSPSRVNMTYVDGDKKIVSKWFMVSCERIKESANFNLIINTYADFPAVKLLLKQEHVDREVLLEIEYELYGAAGVLVDRPLGLEDFKFVAKPVGVIGDFDPNEAFELHFIVTDTANLKFFSQVGFYRDISIFEREARRAVRKYFHKLEADEGKPTEPSIERVLPDKRYTGKVFLVTESYVAIHRADDREQVTLHRLSKLDKKPKIADSVVVTYTGKKGVVS